MVLFLIIPAVAMAGYEPYIAVVGTEFDPYGGAISFYLDPLYQQFGYNETLSSVPVCWGEFPPVTDQTREGGPGCEQFRSNNAVNQPEICDVQGRVVDFFWGNFEFFGNPNAVIRKDNAGYFEWYIRLPRKPSGDINICINCGVIKPDTFTRSNGFFAVERCAAETGERTGTGFCTRSQVGPGVNPIIETALPRITAMAYPGPSSLGFTPFHLTTYKNPGTYNLTVNANKAMTNSAALQVLDGSTSARVLLKSCMDKCVVAKISVTGQYNALGEKEADLEAGDLISVRMDVPGNNTVDIYCHAQSAKIAGIGESPI